MWKWINGAWTWYSDPWWNSPPWARELAKGISEILDNQELIISILKSASDPAQLQAIEASIVAHTKKLQDAVNKPKT